MTRQSEQSITLSPTIMYSINLYIINLTHTKKSSIWQSSTTQSRASKSTNRNTTLLPCKLFVEWRINVKLKRFWVPRLDINAQSTQLVCTQCTLPASATMRLMLLLQLLRPPLILPLLLWLELCRVFASYSLWFQILGWTVGSMSAQYTTHSIYLCQSKVTVYCISLFCKYSNLLKTRYRIWDKLKDFHLSR